MVLPRPVQPDSAATPQGPCFVISRIELTGTTLLSPLAKDRPVAPWVNQCLDMARLNALTNAV